tara:strand:- start:83 stop:649 length:567 start_codon:yes stop_codon:yes gene_type:complete
MDQNLIDDVVDGTLKNTLANAILVQFINESSIYDDFYRENEVELISWIRFGDVFDRDEICYWNDYFEAEDFDGSGISEDQLKEFSNGRKPADEEYQLFLKWWIKRSLENFLSADFPIASIHHLTHSDGRNCVALIAMTEGGQGGWEFCEVFEGLFHSKEDAILYLKENGIVETYSETELETFLSHYSL